MVQSLSQGLIQVQELELSQRLQVQELVLVQKQSLGSLMIQTCLPKTEAYIDEYMEEILHCTMFKWKPFMDYPSTREPFRSVIDMVFCTYFPKFRKSCYDFYLHDGEPLRNLTTTQQQEEFDDAIVEALKEVVLYSDYKEEEEF